MFEITTAAVQATCTLELKGPDDQPLRDADGTPISVTLYGPGSKEYQAADMARNQRNLTRLMKAGKAKASAEEMRADQLQFLAACTRSMNGWSYQGRSDADAILSAYSDPAIGFVVDQVQAAVGDWSNFLSSAQTR